MESHSNLLMWAEELLRILKCSKVPEQALGVKKGGKARSTIVSPDCILNSASPLVHAWKFPVLTPDRACLALQA